MTSMYNCNCLGKTKKKGPQKGKEEREGKGKSWKPATR